MQSRTAIAICLSILLPLLLIGCPAAAPAPPPAPPVIDINVRADGGIAVDGKLVRIEQEKPFGPIYIFPLTDEPAELAVAHAVSADIDRLPSVISREHKHRSADDSSPTGADDTVRPPQGQE